MTMLCMKQREQVRVYLSAEAKREVGKVAESIGIKQIDLLSRICEWFARQEKSEKLRILGILERDEHVGPLPPQNPKKAS